MVKVLYSNDRKAPRVGKSEFSINIVSKELYGKFILDFPEYKDMTFTEFQVHWSEIAKTIRKEIVENPLGTKMPLYMGELKLQYLPYKEVITDHHNTAELGREVNEVNIVTKGKVAHIKWERRWAVKFNRILQFFAFRPARDINVMAKEYIDANPEKLRMSRSTNGGFNPWKGEVYNRQVKK